MSVPTQTRHADPEDPAAFERVPPQNLDAEQAVLGGMLLSKDVIGDVHDVLADGADFYRPAHQTIYRAILHLYGQGEPVDPITVGAYLTQTGEAARVGGTPYLHTLVNAVPTAANAEHYAGEVREVAVPRRLVEAGTRIVSMGYRQEGTATELADAAQAEIFSVIRHQQEDTLLVAESGLDDTVDAIDQASRRKPGELSGLTTGLVDLDSLTDGLQEGQLIVVAGRPAMGKTNFALDLLRACCIKAGRTAAYFSLEMSRKEIHQRLLSAEGPVSLHKIRKGTLDDTEWERVRKARARIGSASMYLDDDPSLTVMSIRTKVRKLKSRGPLDLVIVDYLQLLQHGGGRPENRQQEVSAMSRDLKLLGKELSVPIVALSQLNRGPEQRSDKRPLVSDLRESGAIEQDADMVILLHREDAYEKDSPRAGEADLIIAKHRNGPTATITTAFQGHYSRFVDMAAT